MEHDEAELNKIVNAYVIMGYPRERAHAMALNKLKPAVIDTKDEFSEAYQSPYPPRDILDITLMQASIELDPAELTSLKLKVQMTANVDSRSALKRRVAEFIHMSTIEQKAVRQVELNRRFGRVAKKYGTNTMELSDELIASGRLLVVALNGKNGLVSSSIYKDGLDACKVLERTEDDYVWDLMQQP